LGADLYIAKCSFDKMANHVRLALEEAERRNGVAETNCIIGIEDTFPRQITKELLNQRKHFKRRKSSSKNKYQVLFRAGKT
jgi:transposase